MGLGAGLLFINAVLVMGCLAGAGWLFHSSRRKKSGRPPWPKNRYFRGFLSFIAWALIYLFLLTCGIWIPMWSNILLGTNF
jgi:heme/copper-type cytochrome/quinol oxidase subunit 2